MTAISSTFILGMVLMDFLKCVKEYACTPTFFVLMEIVTI